MSANLDDASVEPIVRKTAAWAWRLLVILAALLAFLWVVEKLEVIVVPVLVALLVSALLVPVVDWLDRHGLPRGPAVTLVLLGGFAILGGILTFVIIQFIDGIPGLTEQVTRSIETTRRWLIDGPAHLRSEQIDNAGNAAIEALHNNQAKLTSGALSTAATVTELGESIEAEDRPALAAKVTPDYPPMAKRMLQDNGSWLRCLSRDHVTLDSGSIIGIDETSITTEEGRYEADVLILATGFRASEMLCPMEIVGRNGVPISEFWDDKPAALNGISVPGFPNFFMMAGPGTGLAHAGSIIFMLECQMRYIGAALRALIEGGHRGIEPTGAAYERYREDLQAEVGTLMWGHRSIEHSWYKSADGGVYVLSPWTSVDYWKRTRTVEPADHQVF